MAAKKTGRPSEWLPEIQTYIDDLKRERAHGRKLGLLAAARMARRMAKAADRDADTLAKDGLSEAAKRAGRAALELRALASECARRARGAKAST